jgi:hypothetical protein
MAVWQYAEDSARYLFGGGTGDPTADLVWEALIDHGGPMSRNDLRHATGKNRPGEGLAAALRRLQDQGVAECVKMCVNSSGRGPKTEMWYLVERDELPGASLAHAAN